MNLYLDENSLFKSMEYFECALLLLDFLIVRSHKLTWLPGHHASHKVRLCLFTLAMANPGNRIWSPPIVSVYKVKKSSSHCCLKLL